MKSQEVSRPAPEVDVLKQAFRLRERRGVRRSDGTISVLGKRYEIPSRYCRFKEVHVAYAEWAMD